MNRLRTVLYVGVTNNLEERIIEHYESRGNRNCFCGRYYVHYLVYFETYRYVNDALHRETEIKGWRRSKKLALISTKNPELKFLNEELFGQWPPPKSRLENARLKKGKRRCQ